jgi:hypothetical protein
MLGKQHAKRLLSAQIRGNIRQPKRIETISEKDYDNVVTPLTQHLKEQQGSELV